MAIFRIVRRLNQAFILFPIFSLIEPVVAQSTYFQIYDLNKVTCFSTPQIESCIPKGFNVEESSSEHSFNAFRVEKHHYLRTQSLESSEKYYRTLLMTHFRKNFDDIHDVSMRFHHKDHRLNGVIDFSMKWENGRLVAVSVVRNETGDPEFGEAILEKMESWKIEGLNGPFETRFPIRIKIVGSDDPTFSMKSIFTGKVMDRTGNPIKGARIEFIPTGIQGVSVPSCRSSREGIFVRTLIPPGIWNIRCSCEGFKDVLLENLEFLNGEHHRSEITLEKLTDGRTALLKED